MGNNRDGVVETSSNKDKTVHEKHNKKWVRKFLPVASEVVVQDPFELNHNVSKGVGTHGLENWKNHCLESAKILSRGQHNLVDIFSLKLELPKPKLTRKQEKL